ncbi:tubulin polymerization-promoting protein homolog [Trichonephila clavipes]|uniref:Tubulin polymerization-promoting protein homolog n=1 Tax=Trichonephila clavipes TaxID=2585209 RepID=A0A8X6S1W7_TRICX|nr:tubulin polymerization-promoting protein homolog [Trichonephila clavipes]
MLHTKLVKLLQLAAPKTPRGATDDGSQICYPRAAVVPPTLFSKSSTPDSDEPFDDPYDAKFSTLNHQMKSSFTETGNTETRFFWMIDLMSFNQLFRLYAKFGDANRSGETMTLTCSDRWLRQAKILDNRRISTIDTGIYFKQVAKFKKALNFTCYQTFLELLAKKKNLNFNEMKYKMVTAGPPETYKMTEVDNRKSVHNVTERPRAHRRYKKRETVKRTYDEFFSNCQCQHGYNSQISYSFPDTLPAPAAEEQEEDWFPEE